MTETTETTTQTTPAPLANTTEARTPDGTLKDASNPNTNPIPETTKEPSGSTDPKPGEKAPVGAPEAYADFTAPEGYTIDKALIEKALPIFKELNLTQDQAQKLVSLQTERELAAAKAPQEAYNAMREVWQKEVFADKTLSNGKELLPEVKARIGSAINSLDPKVATEFREVMDTTGVGDNPAFVRALDAWAKALGEGKPVIGAGPSAEGQRSPDAKPKSIANAMYPNLA